MGGEREIRSGVVDDFVDGRDQLCATHGGLQGSNQQSVVTQSLASGNGAGCISANSVGDEPLARFSSGKIAANLTAKMNFRLFRHRPLLGRSGLPRPGNAGRPNSDSLLERKFQLFAVQPFDHQELIVRSDPLLTALFNQFCDQTGPAGLMASADPGAIVAVEVFVEKDQIAPVRIALKELGAARHGPAAIRIAEKNVNEPPGNFGGYLPEIAFSAGMRGALHFEILAVVVVKFLE